MKFDIFDTNKGERIGTTIVLIIIILITVLVAVLSRTNTIESGEWENLKANVYQDTVVKPRNPYSQSGKTDKTKNNNSYMDASLSPIYEEVPVIDDKK